jgi:hypothetical protein
MANDTKFNKGDEVYIKSLGMNGTILNPRAGNEPGEEELYRVQIVRYCRASDLDLVDHEAAREKRTAEIKEKSDRLAAAQARLEQAGQTGTVPTAVVLEFATAANDLGVALGHGPLLKKK